MPESSEERDALDVLAEEFVAGEEVSAETAAQRCHLKPRCTVRAGQMGTDHDYFGSQDEWAVADGGKRAPLEPIALVGAQEVER
jgi:hypothetical protein